MRALQGLPELNVFPQPILDKKTLEEYLQIEREIADAQRADPNVLPQFKTKMTQLEEVNQRVEQLDEQLKEAPNTVSYSSGTVCVGDFHYKGDLTGVANIAWLIIFGLMFCPVLRALDRPRGPCKQFH